MKATVVKKFLKGDGTYHPGDLVEFDAEIIVRLEGEGLVQRVTDPSLPKPSLPDPIPTATAEPTSAPKSKRRKKS